MPHTTRKNAREWQRLWRSGDIITELGGDDPRMPRLASREDALDQDEIDRLIFDTESPPPGGPPSPPTPRAGRYPPAVPIPASRAAAGRGVTRRAGAGAEDGAAVGTP